MFVHLLIVNYMFIFVCSSKWKGLELIPKDTWATHAMAHVMEMEGRQDEGIEFMSQTMENWKVSYTVNSLLINNHLSKTRGIARGGS